MLVRCSFQETRSGKPTWICFRHQVAAMRAEVEVVIRGASDGEHERYVTGM